MTVIEREAWRNPGRTKIWIKVVDPHNPQATLDKCIGPGEIVDILVSERILNERKIPDVANNFFRNGSLEPVHLVETAADFADLQDNVNVKSDAELQEILGLSLAKLRKELAEIKSEPIIVRLKALTEKDDAENLPLGKVRAVADRYKELVLDPREEERWVVNTEKPIEL